MGPARVCWPALALLCSAWAAAGCALLLPAAPHEVRLPALPPPWRERFAGGGLRCRLVAVSASGAVSERRVRGWPAAVAVDLGRDAPVALLAFPEHRGLRLRPAGGVFAGGDRVGLSWHGGPLASVLAELAARGLDLAAFNVERLETEVGGALVSAADPWLLDTGRLAVEIASGGFRVTDIRFVETTVRALALPAGTWLPESVSASAIICDGRAAIALHAGLNRFFHATSPVRADAWVTERETLVLLVPDR
jgi:hypothetical protein